MKKKKEETPQVAGIGEKTAENTLKPPVSTTSIGIGTNKPIDVETSALPLEYTTSQKTTTQEAENKFMYKGVDTSKPFSSSDFANPKDYEQAKNRAELYGQTGESSQLLLEQQQKQQALSQLGMVGNVSQAELNQIVEQYGLSPEAQRKEGRAGVLREVVPSAIQTGVMTGLGAAVIGGVGSGATAGAIGGPAGIAVGAAAGVVFGLWRGIRQARKSEATEDVTIAMKEFGQLKKGISQTASLANSGYINEVEAVELYNAQLTRMLQVEARVKYLQDTNLKDYLSGGEDDLVSIQTYLSQVAPVYKMKIQTAMLNPQSKVPYSDIIMEDMMSDE